MDEDIRVIYELAEGNTLQVQVTEEGVIIDAIDASGEVIGTRADLAVDLFDDLERGAIPDDEQEALNRCVWAQDKFGWTGVMMTRDDASSALGRDLTDEEWDKVRTSHYWRDMGSVLLESGLWELVEDALSDAGVQHDPFGDDQSDVLTMTEEE
jgi:hypothetical protein